MDRKAVLAFEEEIDAESANAPRSRRLNDDGRRLTVTRSGHLAANERIPNARPNDRTAQIRFRPRSRWSTEGRVYHQGRRRTRRDRIEAPVSDASDPHLRCCLPIEARSARLAPTADPQKGPTPAAAIADTRP